MAVLLGLLHASVCMAAEPPWTTYRGNLQRTGSSDGKPGPAAPKVLWSMPNQEHFIAAPVPHDDRLFVSTLGAFNVSTFMCLSTDPKNDKDRKLWSRTTPCLKMPTVSSPAIVDGKLIFGDGMHQTNGAILHCMSLDKGMPLWQLVLPGTLVHLEGSPTVVNGRVYVGGGAAGVLCVDMNRVTLDGKELDLKQIQKILDEKWKELLAKYEEDKKKDPDFAKKPSEDDLPKPSPLVLWQKGKEKWHVDAPLALVDGKVLVASARLDDEQIGDRSLNCLDARTGESLWSVPLNFNPWGGPSVQGDSIVVGGSSIRYDPDKLKGAKGEVAAFNLADGKEKWHKDVTGGVVSCVALTGDLAIATASDGKVRAFDLKDGDKRWIYDAKMPFFAPVAIAGDTVYAADLKGAVHAIGLTNGLAKWVLDLGADEKVRAPGMCYAGPVVQDGRVYVATCNLGGPFKGKPTCIVCIGEK
jgi:outer membrane protein assembly factor BamB